VFFPEKEREGEGRGGGRCEKENREYIGRKNGVGVTESLSIFSYGFWGGGGGGEGKKKVTAGLKEKVKKKRRENGAVTAFRFFRAGGSATEQKRGRGGKKNWGREKGGGECTKHFPLSRRLRSAPFTEPGKGGGRGKGKKDADRSNREERVKRGGRNVPVLIFLNYPEREKGGGGGEKNFL